MTGTGSTDEQGFRNTIEWDVGEALSPLPCCAVDRTQFDYRTPQRRCPLVLEYRRQGQHLWTSPPQMHPIAAEILGLPGDYAGSVVTKEEVRLRCTLHGGELPIKVNPEFFQALVNASVALAQEKASRG